MVIGCSAQGEVALNAFQIRGRCTRKSKSNGEALAGVEGVASHVSQLRRTWGTRQKQEQLQLQKQEQIFFFLNMFSISDFITSFLSIHPDTSKFKFHVFQKHKILSSKDQEE